MKRDALAFFRILPAGTADVGAGVSREELRAAGLGDWSLTDVGRDDLTDVLGPEGIGPDLAAPARPDPFFPDFDEVLPMEDRPTDPGVPVVELRLRKGR